MRVVTSARSRYMILQFFIQAFMHADQHDNVNFTAQDIAREHNYLRKRGVAVSPVRVFTGVFHSRDGW